MRGPVLMTSDTLGGVWTYSLDLARALGQEGIEVALATMGAPVSADQRRDVTGIPTVELFESTYPLPWQDDPWNGVEAAGGWLLEVCARVRPDVVHLNEPVHASLDWNVPTVAVGHSCVLSWWHAVWKTDPPPTWNRYEQAMRRGLHAADAVVAPSAFMLQALRRHYQLAHGQIIPNGRDATGFAPAHKEPLIFAAGRMWDPAKNLMLLDDLAADLPWPVYIAGASCHPDRTEPAKVLNAHLLGPLPPSQVAEWMARASIYAFPANYEPFGLSVLEAALSGCALVLSDVEPLRELWEGRAVFVDPRDTPTFRTTVARLIEDEELRQTLAMRARRHALTLTPRRMALGYRRVYSAVMRDAVATTEVSSCGL